MKDQTQQLSTSSKVTIETLEQGVKYVHINNKDSRAMTLFCSRVDRDPWHRFLANIYLLKVNDIFLVALLLTLKILRSDNHLARKNIQTTQYTIDRNSNLGTKFCHLLPGEIRNSSWLSVFKIKIGKWIPEKCPCQLSAYIKNIAYIWFPSKIC